MKIITILILVSCWQLHFLAQEKLFTEVGEAVGVDYIYPGGDSQEVGAGVTVIDINNDGWDDFFQTGGVFQSKLWLNKKGKFVDATEDYKLTFLDDYYVQSAVAGDVNNDGYEDLFICNYGTGIRHGDGFPLVLLLNVGGKYFERAMENVFSFKGNFTAATFGDINNDGFLDLYLADYVYEMSEKPDTLTGKQGFDPTCVKNRFFINNNGVSFTEQVLHPNMSDDGCGLSVSFTDFDQDNDVDLILLNDFGSWNEKGNLIFRNDYPNNSFTDISDSSGFYKEIYGMGIGVNDYDNDGDLDYYITNIGQNFLFENDNGIFTDRAKEVGIAQEFSKDSKFSTSWTGLFFDYDNDRDLDLYIANGNVYVSNPVTAIVDPNSFYLNDGGKYEDVSSQSGVDDILSHRGAACIDFDHDGDLDVISSLITMEWGEFGGLDQKIKVFRNNNESKNNWIGIKLVGDGAVNASCIGCSVTYRSSEFAQIKEVDGGSGHGSQSTKIIYFGLSDEKNAEKLEIKWLGGKTQVIEGLKGGKVYKVSESGKVSKLY